MKIELYLFQSPFSPIEQAGPVHGRGSVLPQYGGICYLGSRALTGFHCVLEIRRKAAAPTVILIPFFLANLSFKPLPESLCSLLSHLSLLYSGRVCLLSWYLDKLSLQVTSTVAHDDD